jgi:UDP-GlcNAc:undecaprenyl-phosphate/decaprenyl-phosphate GlcNAc-1-phosphate transferase
MFTDYIPLLLTVAICAFARPIGERLAILDFADGSRKLHDGAVPMVGGIAVTAALISWVAVRLATGAAAPEGLELPILLSVTGVAALGFIDDQQTISPAARLILLAIFAAATLKLDPGLFVKGLHTVEWGWVPMSPALSIGLFVCALVGFSSAVNMADGMTGLVLSLICVWAMCLVLRGGEVAEAAELLAAASFVTLLFNVRGKLFLGDCGAFALAFALGLLAVDCHNQQHLPLETAVVWFLVPVLDCIRLIPVRLWQGRSPFRPDRLHIHHRLAARMGNRAAVLTYVGLVGASSLISTIKPEFSVGCLLFCFALCAGFLVGDALAPEAAGRDESDAPAKVVAFKK